MTTHSEIQSVLEDLAAHGLPAVQITPLAQAPASATSSKFGGQPWWPRALAYPQTAAGAPLSLLAQFNLAELPPLPLWPRQGLLQFFLAEDESHGLEFERPLEQVLATYRLTEAEGVKYLAQLDRIGIIELRPGNRYRLKLAKTFRWRPHGAVMDYFREHALLDYFAGGFDGPGEGVLLVHGSISRSLAPAFMERMQRVAQDFAQQHLADQRQPEAQREGYTLLLALRSWEFEAFAGMRR